MSIYGPNEFLNEKTGKPESFVERTQRLADEKREKERLKWEEYRRLHPSPPTQKESREAKRKQRQAELERAKLTQDDILAKCVANGGIKVTIEDLKHAFPKMISQIEGNNFRTQIDNKQFHDFLLSNSLTFSLPDCVFKKQA